MNDLHDPPVEDADRPDVDVRHLAPPSVGAGAAPAPLRRRVIAAVGTGLVAVLLAGGGVWWQRAVTADPGLEFYAGPHVYRDAAALDRTGIDEKRNRLGTDVDIAFVPDGRLYAHFGLYNGGRHDVSIEAAPASGRYYWAFEAMALSTDPDDGLVGVASHYEPFRPFTLRRGETREVRLDFRLAGCDPAGLQPGGYSSRRAVTLRYRILGVTRTVHVPFRDSVLALRAMGPCADPIIDEPPPGRAW